MSIFQTLKQRKLNHVNAVKEYLKTKKLRNISVEFLFFRRAYFFDVFILVFVGTHGGASLQKPNFKV
jgi:hypothetical protein